MNVLIAEDRADAQALLTGVLQAWGHTVAVTNDGQELIDRLAIDPYSFDMVITDNNMPRLNGIEVLRFLRMKKAFKTLPILVYSADEDIKASVEKLDGIFVSKTDPLDLLLNVLLGI